MPDYYFNETFEVQTVKHANGREDRILRTSSSGTLHEDSERNVDVRLKMAVIDTNPFIERYRDDNKSMFLIFRYTNILK